MITPLTFVLGNFHVDPISKDNYMKNKNREVMVTPISYECESFKLDIGNLEIKDKPILPYLNPKTKRPFSPFVKSKTDPARYNMSIPVDQDLFRVLNGISCSINEQSKDIFKFNNPVNKFKPCYYVTNQYKDIFRFYDLPKGQIEGQVKCKVNFRFDKTTNKITTKIYKVDDNDVEQEIEPSFAEIEDKLNDMNEIMVIDLLLAFDNVWINN